MYQSDARQSGGVRRERKRFAKHPNFSRVWGLKASNNPHQRRLARSVLAHDGSNLTWRNRNRHPIKRLLAAELLRHE